MDVVHRTRRWSCIRATGRLKGQARRDMFGGGDELSLRVGVVKLNPLAYSYCACTKGVEREEE